MPTYIVVSPDSGKKYKVTAPEGSSPAQLKARVRNFEGRIGYRNQDLVRSRLMQTLTLGGWDEIAGATQAVTKKAISMFGGDEVDFKQAYEEAKAQELAKAELAGRLTPYSAAAADVAGMLAGGVGGAVKGAVAKAAPSVTKLITGGAKTGAVTGGVSGALSGEGVEGRAFGALGGGTIGSLLGGLTPAAFLGTVRGAQWLKRNFAGDLNAGMRYLQETMNLEGIDPKDITSYITRSQDLGADSIAADVSPGLMGVLRGALLGSGPQATQAKKFLRERQAGMGDRLKDAIRNNLGPITNINKVEKDLRDKASAAAAPLYEAAYKKRGVWNDTIEGVIKTDAGQRALKKAKILSSNEQVKPSEISFVVDPKTGFLSIPRRPTMKTLDYIKRGFDDVIEEARDTTTGLLKVDNETRAIIGLRNKLVEQLDELNPTYKQARDAWSGPISANTAMKDGQKAAKYSPDDLELILSTKSPTEKEFFKLGFRKALSDTIDGKGDYADKARNLLGTQRKRDVLQNVFGADTDFSKFTESVAKEMEGALTYKSIFGGSDTAMKLADALEWSGAVTGVPGALAGVVRGDPGGILQGLTRKLTEDARAVTRRAASQDIMSVLMANNPQVASRRLAEMARANAQETAMRARQSRAVQAIPAPISAIAGLSTGPAVSIPSMELQPIVTQREEEQGSLIGLVPGILGE